MYYIYCRKSTEEQNDTSFETQTKTCEKWIKGKAKVTVIKETGSGADSHRPQLNLMLSKLKMGDVVCIYDNSRLSRDMLDALSILHTITQSGASLICDGKTIDPNNPQDLFTFYVHSAFSDYQRGIQKQKSLAGMTQKRLNGDWIPSSLFGYTITHKKHPTVVINEEEAKWVRYAFNEFINGKPYRQIALFIARQLNKRIPTGRIVETLRNPNYMSFYYIETVKNPTEKTKFYLRSREEIEQSLIKSNLIPPIVDSETWFKAHEVEMAYRERGNRKQYWNRHRTSFLLTGIVSCEYCGVNARHVTRNNHGHHKEAYELAYHEPSCINDNKVIDASLLETIAEVSYFTTLLSYEQTASFFTEEQEKIQRDTSELRKQVDSIEGQIVQNKKKISRWMSLFEEGEGDLEEDVGEFKERIKELRKEIQSLASQKQAVENDISIKEADISDMLGELTTDRIQDFIHFNTQKRNIMFHTICDKFSISKDSIHISFRNGMSYEVKLNEKFKQWSEAIEIKVFFRNELEFIITLDRDSLTVELDCEEETDIWKKYINDYYKSIVDECNKCLSQIS